MSYTDQATIEAYLNRDLTANEVTILPSLLAFIDKKIDDMQGGSYGVLSESTRFYDGGFASVQIDPCRSVSAVELVGTDNQTARTYTLNEDVVLRPVNEPVKRWLDRRNLSYTYPEQRFVRFPRGKANVKVTAIFNLGETPPDEVKFLATYMVARLFEIKASQGLKSESIEGYSRTYAEIDWANDPVVAEYVGDIFERDILL